MPTLTGKKGIRAFLLRNIGKVVTTAQIFKASGEQGQYGRRLRELREDEGWPIKSHNDDNKLMSGEYVLTGKPPRNPPKMARSISGRLRAEVFQRNGNTCQMCGAGAGDKDDRGRVIRLHIGHIKDRAHGGKDELSNLRALCSACNQGAKHLTQEPPSWTWLLGRVRVANRQDQQKLYDWLKQKFGE